MSTDVRPILEGLGYKIPDAKMYDSIALWKSWYQGVTPFHKYTQFNGRKKISRTRKALRMAKRVCADHANLLLNEKVKLVLTDKTAQTAVDKAIKENKFRVQGNKLIEVSFALGTGAFVEHADGTGGTLIDFVRADMIYPLAWEGENISDCAFASIRIIQGKEYLYLNVHQKEQDEYVIRNQLIDLTAVAAAAKAGTKEAPQPVKPGDDGLLFGILTPEVKTGSPTPRFQFISPNQVNSIDMDSPLGASVFADALDTLEGVDLVYDSYCNEFRLGKKRIIVPLTMLDLVQDAEGTPWMAFDDNDTEFYGLKDDNLKEIKEINMDLRTEAHETGLQRQLNLLSAKCGLGNDRYEFSPTGVKTATEVISEKSELFQNLKKNELVLEAALQGMCQAIAEIAGVKTAFETKVNFDDSIIEDTDAKRARMQLLVTQGKFPLWRYLNEYEGYSEKDAKEIADETEVTEPDVGTNFTGV